MKRLSQQPLFVYVPAALDREMKETSQVVTQEVSQPVSSTILPDYFDAIHNEFVETLSEATIRRMNGRLERGLDLAKQGYVSVWDADHYSVKGNTGPQSWYEVDLEEKSCECPDHKAGYTCKHRYAAWLTQQVNQT